MRILALAARRFGDIDPSIFSDAAQLAYDTVWGEKVPGHKRGALLMELAQAIEANADELASIESLDNGKAYSFARGFDVPEAAACLRYYGGWADKNHGKVSLAPAIFLVLPNRKAGN